MKNGANLKMTKIVGINKNFMIKDRETNLEKVLLVIAIVVITGVAIVIIGGTFKWLGA